MWTGSICRLPAQVISSCFRVCCQQESAALGCTSGRTVRSRSGPSHPSTNKGDLPRCVCGSARERIVLDPSSCDRSLHELGGCGLVPITNQLEQSAVFFSTLHQSLSGRGSLPDDSKSKQLGDEPLQ